MFLLTFLLTSLLTFRSHLLLMFALTFVIGMFIDIFMGNHIDIFTQNLQKQNVFHQHRQQSETFDENPCVKMQKNKNKKVKNHYVLFEKCTKGSFLVRILM